MTCSCNQGSAASDNSQASNGLAEKSGEEALEVFSFLSLVDGLNGFYGQILGRPDGFPDPTASEIHVKVKVAGVDAVYKLIAATRDAFEAGLVRNNTVAGAFTPSRAIVKGDSPEQSDFGQYIIIGNAIVVEKWFVPGQSADGMFRTWVTDASELKPIAVALGMAHPEALSPEQIEAINVLLSESLQNANETLRKSRNPAQLLSLLRTLLDSDFLAKHFALIAQKYSLISTDVVPGKPGKDSGKIHCVFRYVHVERPHLQTLLSTGGFTKREEFDIPNCNGRTGLVFELVDPEAWSPDACTRCRISCGVAVAECMKQCEKHGPKSLECMVRCLDEAASCYASCACS